MVSILPVRSHNNTDSPIGLLDLENIVIAVEILFLSCVQAEIEVFPVLEAAILDISLPFKNCTTFQVVLLDKWTQKTSIRLAKFRL